MNKRFDANGTDIDAYPDLAYKGGIYESRKANWCPHYTHHIVNGCCEVCHTLEREYAITFSCPYKSPVKNE